MFTKPIASSVKKLTLAILPAFKLFSTYPKQSFSLYSPEVRDLKRAMASGTRSGRQNPTSDNGYQPSNHPPLQNRSKGHQSQGSRPQGQATDKQPPSNEATRNQPPTNLNPTYPTPTSQPYINQPERNQLEGSLPSGDQPHGSLSHETELPYPPSSRLTEDRTRLAEQERDTPTETSRGNSGKPEKPWSNKDKKRGSKKSSRSTFNKAPSIGSIKLGD
ncbi:MAG: hypothetical protein L6R41_004593 [Letrouitia leprolyta]|nr:MAG: hypothetical protein L6R41_004593 [Letrouitia leprolyta]